MSPRRALCAALAGLVLAPLVAAQELPLAEERPEPPERMTAEEARPALERSYAWLLANQNDDGSWASPVIESVWEDNFAFET